jgi:hypothetical protein
MPRDFPCARLLAAHFWYENRFTGGVPGHLGERSKPRCTVRRGQPGDEAMKVRTKVKAGGKDLNHNESLLR